MVTEAGADVVDASRLSVAFAVNVYVPAASALNVRPQGADVCTPRDVAPEKNSTRTTDPSGSEASAPTKMEAGATSVPAYEITTETTGGWSGPAGVDVGVAVGVCVGVCVG